MSVATAITAFARLVSPNDDNRATVRGGEGLSVIRKCATVLIGLIMLGGSAWAQHGGAPAAKYPDPSLTGPPISWTTDLSADEESAFTESPGIGHADFTLDRATLKFSWKVTFDKLIGKVTGVRIHGPQTPGGEAGVLIDLGAGGLSSPVQGFAILNDGQLRYLVTDRMYIQITSTKYPAGEIRGQLQRVRPKP